jgi:hypothetical protein
MHHHFHHVRRRRGARLLALGASAALVLGACGDDDDTASDATDAPAATADAEESPATTAAAPATAGADTTAAAPATTEMASDTTAGSAGTTGDTGDTGATGDQGSADPVCGPYLEVTAQFNGEPDPATLTAALDEVDANTPDELTDVLGTMTSAAREVLESGGQDFAPFETPEFMAAQTEVDGWVFENCAFDATYEVIATEYAFEGLPEEVEPGLVAVRLVNEGQEAHEIGIARKAEGTTETWQELLELPEEEAESKVVFVGGGFAPMSGSEGYAFLDLSESGEYAALCFIPTGTVMSEDGEVTEGSGPPHFVQGMIAEFNVSA